MIPLSFPKILLVEDEKEISDEVREYLETLQYRVTVSTNAQEAILKCANQKFDCILTDINLDKSSGVKVIQYLREHRNEMNHDTPIVIVSSQVSHELLSIVRPLVNWIFVKPYKLGDIKKKLEDLNKKEEVKK